MQKSAGMRSHKADCDCRLCWNVRLKREGLAVDRAKMPLRRRRRRGRR